MATGDALTTGDGRDMEFLVNFQQKKQELKDMGETSVRHESTSKEHDVNYREVKELPDVDENPLIVHYDPSEDKGRVFGASHGELITASQLFNPISHIL